MAVAELHFFHPEDPNGATLFECSTDDQWVKNIELDIQRDSLGSGRVNFARKVPAGGLFTREIVVPEALVRVLVPEIDATHYLHAFFINPRQQQVVSRDESGGEGFTFAGPGPKHYLERMILWSASFSGYDNAVERESGIWTWPSTARAGAILNRLLQEDQDNPHGPFLPDLTASFGDVNDSAGVPWADDIAGDQDFTLRIQDDYLRILWLIEDASGIVTTMNLGTVSNPLLQLNAYQTFGRDLTEDVQFVEGINIATDLDVEGSSYKKASHALVKGNDGFYNFAENPSYVPGDLKKVVGISYDSSNTATLDRAGERFLRRQDNGERQIDLRIVPGFDAPAGLYMPSPEAWGNGHFWVGDVVSLTTGISPNQTELDYDDEAQDVTGIKMELTEAVRDDTALMAARSWEVTVQLNKERKQSGGSTDLAGSRGTTQAPPNVVRLCRLPTEGESSVARLYPSNTDLDITADPAIDASWEEESGSTQIKLLKSAPDASYSASNNQSSSDGGVAGGQDCYYARWGIELDADLAQIIEDGGATIHGQFRTRARFGTGISESSQHMISQIGVRVTTGDSTTIRGTALALHSLATTAGSTEWTAQSTRINHAFPPAAATNVLSAVPGAAAGDYLIIEIGSRNFTTVTSGGSIAATNDADTDLPVDEITTTALTSWIEIAVTGSGAFEGDLPLDTVRQDDESVGTATRVARCDHQHAHGLLSVDGTNYHSLSDLGDYIFHSDTAPTASDDEGDGYVVGSHWIDSTDDAVYVLVDSTEGAAVWVELSGAGGGSALTVEEEDGTPSDAAVTKIEVPNGSLTVDSAGVVSLDYALSGHGHGSVSLPVPTLLQSEKASADTPDDEFSSGTLDSKWVVVDGASGTASLLNSSGTGLYDLSTRSGWLLMQIGTGTSDEVLLRQDFTIPDGAGIVTYASFVTDWGATPSNNEMWVGIGVNSVDTGPYDDAAADTATLIFDQDGDGFRIIGLAAPSPTIIGSGATVDDRHALGAFLRIDRTGLAYDLFYSTDGFGWTYVGRQTLPSAADNIWLFARCDAVMTARMVVGFPWFRQGVALAIDPWPL